MQKRDNCLVCEEPSSSPLLTFKDYPITETYVPEEVVSSEWNHDQAFSYCGGCGHGQLVNVLDQEALYGNAYRFRTSESVWGATKGNDTFMRFIDESMRGRSFKRIIEIGCNDAYLLESLSDRAEELIGVDPILEDETRGKIQLIGDFYENANLSTADSLVVTHQVLEHLEDPKGLLREIMSTSNENTTCIFGFPSLDYLVHDSRFDQIFHHHLNYFSERSTSRLLDDVGANCFNRGWNPHYWGTIMMAFESSKKKNKPAGLIKEEQIQESFQNFIEKMSRFEEFVDGGTRDLYCYGANLQFPVLNYHIPSIDEKALGIIDDDSSKSGFGYPNMETRIIHGDEVDLEDKDVAITAINFSRAILPRVIQAKPHRIYLPFNSLP